MGRKPVVKAVALRIPVSLHRQLHAEAERRMVSVTYLVTKAIERFLESLPPLDEDEPPS